MHTSWPIAWKQSMRHLGWVYFVLCGGVMGLLLGLATAVWDGQIGPFAVSWLVAYVVPVFAGWQAAYAFSPDDERPLELFLVAPRPILWLLLERVGLLLVVYLALGAVGAWLTLATHADTTLGELWLRWLPPLVWFIGLGLYLALLTRQGTFGALVVLVVWGVSLVGSGGLPNKLRWIAPLLPYLQPGAVNVSPELYTWNRVILVVGGLLLVGLAIRLSRNEAHLLGIREVWW